MERALGTEHAHALGVLLDSVHRAIESYLFGEQVGHALRYLPGAADKLVLLSAAFHSDHRFQPMTLAQYLQEEEVGHLRGFRAQNGLGDQLYQASGGFGVNLSVDPGLERLPVEFGGVISLPWCEVSEPSQVML